MRPALLALVLAGCGGGRPAEQCVTNGLPVVTEVGVDDSCEYYGEKIQTLRVLFVEHFGQINLRGWSVHVSPQADVYEDSAGAHSARTSWNTNTSDDVRFVVGDVLGGSIVISQTAVHKLFAHELYHVKLGPQSAAHAEPEWCSRLSPWEISEGLEDERQYLGCPL